MSAAPARRTAWTVILGVLMIIFGVIILGNTVVATAVSILVIGWIAIISGVVSLVGAFVNRAGSGLWLGLVSGVLLLILGILILRNPVAGAFGLTVVLGIVFFARGITTLITGFTLPTGKALFIVSGIVSLILGLIVLFNLFTMTLTLLGILLGVELIVHGLTVVVVGRPRRAVQSPR